MDTRLLALCLCGLTVAYASKVNYNGDTDKNSGERDSAIGALDYDFTYYLTWDQIDVYLDEMAALCGSRCSMETIGHSWFANKLRVFMVSTVGVEKRSIWLHAGARSDVHITVATALYFIERLVKDYDTDPDVQNILNYYNVFVLPTINPDGYEYTMTTNSTWNKNLALRPESFCRGVDLSRNLDIQWNETNIQDACNGIYPGPVDFSEPESSAMGMFIIDRTAPVDLYIEFLENGNQWLTPNYYRATPPADIDELMRVAQAGASAVTAVYGTSYDVATGAGPGGEDVRYGTSLDWAHDVMGIPYVYTVNPRDPTTSSLPDDQIIPNGNELWAGFKAAVAAIKNP